MRQLIFASIYIVQYVALYGIIFALNRIFGLVISTNPFSAQMFLSALITGIPLGLLLFKFLVNNWIVVLLSLLHYFIISSLWNFVIT